MEDQLLREFLDLASTCNYQDTAENMSVSASALSKHIQKMEQELGVPLFDRSTRTVSLNNYGAILQEYAAQIIALTDRYQADIENARKIEASQLNIAFLPMLGRFGVLEALTAFNREHPEITLNIVESNNPEEHLLDGKFSFVFVDAYGPKDSQITKLLYQRDHLVAVFPEGHPLAGRESVTLEDLRDENFLLQVRPDGLHTITSKNFLTLCEKAGFTPKVSQTSRHISTIARLVAGGRGVAILFSSEILDENNSRCAVVDITPEIPFDMYVSYAHNLIRTETGRTFLRYLKEHAIK